MMGKVKTWIKMMMAVVMVTMLLGTSAMAGETELFVFADSNESIEYAEPTTELPDGILDLNLRERVTRLEWTILPNNRLESVPMYIEAGQQLRLSGAVRSDGTINFRFGYTDHNTDHYVVGDETFGHAFTIQESGYYNIFFRNYAWNNLSVYFMYGIYDT